MNALLAIAKNTFLETIRDRILNAILVFAVLMILSSLLLGQLSAGQDAKIILDLGLASIGFFGVVISIFVGTSLVHKELDKRTVFVVLTKPVARELFLAGKMVGLLATLTLLVLAMAFTYFGLLMVLKIPVHLGLLQAVGFAWLELLVLTCLTMLFSTFTSPVLCMLYAFALYLIGHNAATFEALARKAAPGLRELLLALYWLLPNLSLFDFKNQAVYQQVASSAQVWGTVAYAGAYSALLFGVAALVFGRREF